MKIVIAGSGALGRLLAARLSSCLRADDSLTLVDHDEERAGRLGVDGFQLTDRGATTRHLLPVTADPATIGGCDILFLATRADNGHCLPDWIASQVNAPAVVVCLQRGVQQVEHPPHPGVVIAVSSAEVFSGPDNTVICEDPGTIQLGSLEKAAPGARAAQIAQLLNRAGLRAEETPDIRTAAWERFCIDAAVNPLAAIYRRPNGQLLTSCSVRGNLKKCLREIQAVARAVGIKFDGDPVKKVFQFLRTKKDASAPMLRDILEQRPTEIEALNGVVCRMGRELAIPTPINDDFRQRIQTVEDRHR